MPRGVPKLPKEKRTKPIPVTESNTAPFHVVLTTGNLVYESSGKSISDAIRNLNPKVFKIKGVLKAEHEGKKAELFLRPIWMRRLGVNKDMQLITEKKLMLLMR